MNEDPFHKVRVLLEGKPVRAERRPLGCLWKGHAEGWPQGGGWTCPWRWSPELPNRWGQQAAENLTSFRDTRALDGTNEKDRGVREGDGN